MKRLENASLVFVLAAIVLLPLTEATLRKFFHVGISNAAVVLQHLTLVAGMVGGAVAAREDRLLTLSKLGSSLRGPWKAGADIFAGSCSVAVALLLAKAGLDFTLAERGSEQVLAYGIPLWLVQAFIPGGFALIAIRLMSISTPTWLLRGVVAGLAGLWIALWNAWPLASLVGLGVASLAGVPAFVTLAGLALALVRHAGEPIASIPISHYSLATNAILPTIPMFTLAGYVMASGKAPDRLVAVFRTLFGRLRGGAAIITTLVCTFFTSFTGGSGVTILALGGLLMPMLLERRYRDRDALGLVTGAGSLGLLLPPCLPLILFAIVARVPVESMFLGGLLPALVMLAATACWGIVVQPKDVGEAPPFEWAVARGALWHAKWDLMMPVVAMVALFSGFATPVEAAAVTALYALVVGTALHGDLQFFPKNQGEAGVAGVMTECGLLIGGVLLVQGVALGFTNYLVDAEFLSRAADWTTSVIHSRWVFLLALNLFLLIVGCLMEIYAAIVIQAPLLVTIGHSFGVDPIHLGIIFLANLELGYLTPPVGLNLMLSSLRFRRTVPEVLRAVTPLTLVMGVGVLLITYIPELTLALPRWLGK